jgi:tetratricopeptide (TPR) repeat protein
MNEHPETMTRKVLRKILGVVSLTIFLSLPAHAQEQWKFPEKAANLQYFPKDFSSSRLRSTMAQFSGLLGVRCSYCHKGEEGKPLSTYDFASDENPNKDRARVMLRMVDDINADLKKIQPSGDQRITVWCHTCHRGRPRPMSLTEELAEQYRLKGIQAALDHYAELKKQYYASGSYDFREGELNTFGYILLGKDPAGAVQIFKLNAEQYPQSGNVWDSLGEAYLKAGDKKKAEESYEKSLALDPTNENAKAVLKKIRETKEEPKPQ